MLSLKADPVFCLTTTATAPDRLNRLPARREAADEEGTAWKVCYSFVNQ